MFNQLINAPKKYMHISMIALFITASSYTSYAQATATDSASSSAAIKYVGMEDYMYKFDVSYHNATGSKFIVEIKESDGYAVFSEIYTDENFSKRFLFSKEIDNKFTVVIRSLDHRYVRSFEINTSENIQEDVAVRRIR
jgi:myo-inositol-hexaphosphate 3-phosphohydrolase